MNVRKSVSFAILLSGCCAGIPGLASGAIVLQSEENNCSNLVRKLSDLLAEGDRNAPAYDLLKTVYAQKLARDCGLHVVQPSETPSRIARKYGITISELRRLNPEIKDARPPLEIFQVLRIREKVEHHDPKSSRTNGSAELDEYRE